MGPVGMPEMIVILIVGLLVLGLPALIAIGIIVYSRRNSNPPPAPPPAPPLASRESRLLELEALRAKNLVSETEFQEQRKRILESI